MDESFPQPRDDEPLRPPAPPIQWISVRVALLALVLATSAATCDPPPSAFFVKNETGQQLEITILPATEGFSPDFTVGGNGINSTSAVPDRGCTGTAVVAQAEDGTEVARLDQPACDPDLWVITDDGSYLVDR